MAFYKFDQYEGVCIYKYNRNIWAFNITFNAVQSFILSLLYGNIYEWQLTSYKILEPQKYFIQIILVITKKLPIFLLTNYCILYQLWILKTIINAEIWLFFFFLANNINPDLTAQNMQSDQGSYYLCAIILHGNMKLDWKSNQVESFHNDMKINAKILKQWRRLMTDYMHTSIIYILSWDKTFSPRFVAMIKIKVYTIN